MDAGGPEPRAVWVGSLLMRLLCLAVAAVGGVSAGLAVYPLLDHTPGGWTVSAPSSPSAAELLEAGQPARPMRLNLHHHQRATAEGPGPTRALRMEVHLGPRGSLDLPLAGGERLRIQRPPIAAAAGVCRVNAPLPEGWFSVDVQFDARGSAVTVAGGRAERCPLGPPERVVLASGTGRIWVRRVWVDDRPLGPRAWPDDVAAGLLVGAAAALLGLLHRRDVARLRPWLGSGAGPLAALTLAPLGLAAVGVVWPLPGALQDRLRLPAEAIPAALGGVALGLVILSRLLVFGAAPGGLRTGGATARPGPRVWGAFVGLQALSLGLAVGTAWPWAGLLLGLTHLGLHLGATSSLVLRGRWPADAWWRRLWWGGWPLVVLPPLAALAPLGDAGPEPATVALVALAWDLLVGVWALNLNARHHEVVNVGSLLLCLGLALSLEGAARVSVLGVYWGEAMARRQVTLKDGGWRTAQVEFAALEEARPAERYPDRGYPVAAPPRRPGVARIVCLGGSSTGGAYQMDDLSLFYPAELERRYQAAGRAVEVVNQGVGGWNTWHMREFGRRSLATLDPDLLTLYIGYNDTLTRLPYTYRDYWARYQNTSPAVERVQVALAHSRLYHGLRQLLVGIRDPGLTPAVPLEHARENLTEILDLASAAGAKVLLMVEANQHPHDLDPYKAMLRALAEGRPGVGVLDLDGPLGQHDELFLDDVHLNVAGHKEVASRIFAEIDARGLLPQ